ncbi:MAG: hypothetical protein AAF004_04565 [Pseudomonadota bacterium]
MFRTFLALVLCLPFATAVAQTSTITLSSADFTVSPIFSDIREFTITIEIDQAVAVGVYDNPPLVSVDYDVTGTLAAGTPSGFTAFALSRSIPGADFYAQGSSLRFEVDANANLQDGVQVSELVGADAVFTFDGREVDNGRFHPAILTLDADGTGRIQNSNNVVSSNPLEEVMPGEEYVTDLSYLPLELTLLDTTQVDEPTPTPSNPFGVDSGGGAFGLWVFALFGGVLTMRRRRDLVSPK